MNRADFHRIARDRIRNTPGATLDPDAITVPGSALNIITMIGTAMAEECESRSQARFAAQLVASATEGDLDRLILELSKGKLPRKGPAPACMYGWLTRPVPAPLPGGQATVPAGTKISAGGFTWSLDESVPFNNPGTATEKYSMGFFTCDQTGAQTNGVGPNNFSFVTPAALFDPALKFQSIEGASVGGADREDDVAYRDRFALWNRGLDSDLDRLAAGARGLPGIAASTAQEDIDLSTPDEKLPLGSVTIYVGDVDGKATEALLRRVKLALSGFRLLGQLVKVWGIVPQLVGLTLRFGVLDAFDVAQVRDDVRASMLLAVNRLNPGMPLRRPALESLLAGLPGVVLLPNVPPVVMFLQDAPPAGAPAASPDLVPTDPRTAYRTTAELITFA